MPVKRDKEKAGARYEIEGGADADDFAIDYFRNVGRARGQNNKRKRVLLLKCPYDLIDGGSQKSRHSRSVHSCKGTLNQVSDVRGEQTKFEERVMERVKANYHIITMNSPGSLSDLITI